LVLDPGRYMPAEIVDPFLGRSTAACRHAAGIDAFASAHNAAEPQSRMRDFLEGQAKRKARA
jgi:hypothetical protein